MIYQFIILLILSSLNESREEYRIHNVNLTDGRKDLSIISTNYDNGYIFKVVPGHNTTPVVTKATLIEQINSTGWGHLRIQSSPEYSDHLQAYLNGVIEGIISRPLIAAHWSNTYQGYCANPNDYCKRLFKYLKENFLSIVDKSRNSNGFLKMIRLQLWQIKGVQDGYDRKWKTNSSEINEEYLLTMQNQIFEIYLLQADCDLGELSRILNGNQYHSKFVPSPPIEDGRCSALVKYVKGSIYCAHVTWSPYNIMLRLTKLYDFPYRINSNEKSSGMVPGRKITFSSYPGQLSSLDDFYVTSSGLVTMETTIDNFNPDLDKPYRHMASEIVLEYARADAANRLAMSGADWSTIFSMNNSGTYNNQWMIIDYNRMKGHRYGERIPDGVLYVAEQLPGIIASGDMSEHLRNSKYWASYNLPFNRTIWKKGGFQALVDKFGDFFDYYKTPRAQMFKRNVSGVIDEESLMRLMRYNDFKHDPLSRCDCSPPYSANNGISSRNDLNLKSGRYPFGALAYRLQGGTDMKFTTLDLAKNMSFVGICGPTFDQQPVFDWSKVTGSPLKHNMHPIRFEFPPVLTPFGSNEH